LTRSFNGTFSPDVDGRPIQISVWYPAGDVALLERP
jgi:hypothetical protein